MKSEKRFLLFVRMMMGEQGIQRSGHNHLYIATSGYQCALLRVALPPDSLQALLSWPRRWVTSLVVASSSSSISLIWQQILCVLKLSITNSYLTWLLCFSKRFLLLTLTLYLLFHGLYIQCPIPVQCTSAFILYISSKLLWSKIFVTKISIIFVLYMKPWKYSTTKFGAIWYLQWLAVTIWWKCW